MPHVLKKYTRSQLYISWSKQDSKRIGLV